MNKFVDGIEFVTEECCTCGIPFAMTADLHQRRRDDHESVSCPNGHQQHYTGKTEAQKLREQLERRERDLEAERGRSIALRYQRDQVSKSYRKMRERVKNGVCPCCNRTFPKLLEHMRTKRPEFDGHGALKLLRDIYGLTQSAVAQEIGVPPAYISNYERQRPVPEYAENEIQRWVEANA